MRGRAHNAGLLERWIARQGYPVETISMWSEGQWLLAAQAAGIVTAVRDGKPPSDKTIGIAIGLVAGRYRRTGNQS